MRGRTLALVAVAAVTLAALLAVAVAFALRSSSSPLVLKLVTSAPSGTIDDNGTDLWLLSLTLSNRSAEFFMVDRGWPAAAARVNGNWRPTLPLTTARDLRPHSEQDVLLLVPFSADACRLETQFVIEPLHLRCMRILANLGLWRYSWYRYLAPHIFPIGWLQPVKSDYLGSAPRWRQVTTEVLLPGSSVTNGP